MSKAPFSLRISPGAAVTSAPRSTEVLTITNAGSKALRITTSVQDLGRNASGHCQITPSKFTAHFSPSKFTLAPGQTRTVRAMVSIPSGTTGSHDVVLVASGTTSSDGTLSVHGNVTSLLEYTGPGHAAKACIAMPVQHHASGITVAEAAGGLSALVLCLAASVALVRHRMRSIPHRARHATGRSNLWEA